MRNVLPFLPLLGIALAAPDLVLDFLTPAPESNSTIPDSGSFELLKRQTGCAAGYAACLNLNAPGLCCRTSEVCSADAARNVACCPLGAACTGTISPVNPGLTVSATTTPPVIGGPTTNPPIGVPTTTQNPGEPMPTFQQSGPPVFVPSTVSNLFYPFAYIPTTYPNAAACSSAYTSCQMHAARCTNDLANGVQGMTVSAPNGGATITAIASLGLPSASAICSSLSLQACAGLQVVACQVYGNGNTGAAATRCGGNLYGVGAGVALGVAGQLLR